MHFPDATPKIAPARFKNNSRIIYTDKDKVDHNGIVLQSQFKSLLTGYQYMIQLDEPYNGHTNLLVNEKHLNAEPKPVKEKKTKKSKKAADETAPEA